MPTATETTIAVAHVGLAASPEQLAVDREAGTIKGLTVIAEGPALGHGFLIDDKMLRQVRDAINANRQGVKSRFGHPPKLQDGIGTFLGRVSNARLSSGRVVADLRLCKSAKSAPSGDLFAYALALAADDPSAAGMSISFEHADFEYDDAGTPLARLAEIFTVDLVDEPAAAPEGLLSRRRPGGSHRVTAAADRNADTLAEGIRDGILLRAGALPQAEAHERAREFAGRTLLEIGRVYLDALGVEVDDASAARLLLARGQLIDRVGDRIALYHGVGDFADILADAFNVAATRAYREAPPTWERWARRGTAPDFKTINRVRLSEAPSLSPINPNGEVKYVTLEDSKETYALAEFGQIVPITRRVLVNDQLDVFSRVPSLQGRAARRKEDEVAYAALTSNPVMSEDDKALFHADHDNLQTGSGNAGEPNIYTLDALTEAMMAQRDLAGAAVLGTRPRFLIVPTSLKATAEAFLAAEFDYSDGDAAKRPNNYRNRLELVVADELTADSTSAWYVAADPAEVDTVEVSFLAAEPEPVFGQEVDFDTEGLKLKVRHTVAAKALDFRGVGKNTGA